MATPPKYARDRSYARTLKDAVGESPDAVPTRTPGGSSRGLAFPKPAEAG